MAFDAGDAAHLEQILELIAHISRRLDGLDQERFRHDRDEVDLTAYRLAAIGEATQKLSKALKERHPTIPWSAIYAMRNIIAHDYGSVLPDRVWNVTEGQLEELAEICARELRDLTG
jgi:uncharacterized protein with HEPN domain